MNKTKTLIGTNLGENIKEEFLNAKKSILISTPAISLSIWEIIFKILKKDIKIKIITSEKGGSDSEKTNQIATKLINEQNGKFSNLLEYKIIKKSNFEVVHPKIYIIDEKTAIVGSANLTENGFYNFVEFIEIFKEKSYVDTIKDDFNKLWQLLE
tara:strand:+ start:2048 stop:2512 length:465 start_codon:yes stop_codon:yes gene_type:complete